jgi:hypothetical protein
MASTSYREPQPLSPAQRLDLQILAEKCLHNAGVRPEQMRSYTEDLPVYRTSTGKYRYPLRRMKVGQHFFVRCREGQNVTKLQNSVSSSVGYVAKRSGLRFTQRRLGNGIRVWRVA